MKHLTIKYQPSDWRMIDDFFECVHPEIEQTTVEVEITYQSDGNIYPDWIDEPAEQCTDCKEVLWQI